MQSKCSVSSEQWCDESQRVVLRCEEGLMKGVVETVCTGCDWLSICTVEGFIGMVN